MYNAQKLSPFELSKMATMPIIGKEKTKQDGKTLDLLETYEVIKALSDNFNEDNADAAEIDMLLFDYLTKAGFFDKNDNAVKQKTAIPTKSQPQTPPPSVSSKSMPESEYDQTYNAIKKLLKENFGYTEQNGENVIGTLAFAIDQYGYYWSKIVKQSGYTKDGFIIFKDKKDKIALNFENGELASLELNDTKLPTIDALMQRIGGKQKAKIGLIFPKYELRDILEDKESGTRIKVDVIEFDEKSNAIEYVGDIYPADEMESRMSYWENDLESPFAPIKDTPSVSSFADMIKKYTAQLDTIEESLEFIDEGTSLYNDSKFFADSLRQTIQDLKDLE